MCDCFQFDIYVHESTPSTHLCHFIVIVSRSLYYMPRSNIKTLAAVPFEDFAGLELSHANWNVWEIM